MPPRYRQQSTTDTSQAPGKQRPHDQDEHNVDDSGRIEDGLTRAASKTEDALRKRLQRERHEIAPATPASVEPTAAPLRKDSLPDLTGQRLTPLLHSAPSCLIRTQWPHTRLRFDA